MNHRFLGGILSLSIGCLLAFSSPASAQWANGLPKKPGLPTLWLIGDSTVRNGQDTGGNGQWGWGNPIASFFDLSKINVQNRAMGGTSSRSYINLGLWDKVMAEIQPGDYLIMQFGTNDSGPLDDPARARGTIGGNGEETKEIDNPITKKHEVVHTYGWYLRKYVSDAKSKGIAHVAICSLVPRNSWANGKMNRNTKYSSAAQAAAKEAEVDFINLNDLAAARCDAEGQKKVTDTYFPEKEVVHTDWAGAILNADCVVTALKGLDQNDLKTYLLPNPPQDLKPPSGKAR
jgi:lysophospholipase L1-like esterase